MGSIVIHQAASLCLVDFTFITKNLYYNFYYMKKYDCILVPGGGLRNDGSLPPWTISRLAYALSLKDHCRWIGLLSGGTVHKPPPLDPNGFPIHESRLAADYLIQAGLDPEKILTEISSYDTIGNAYFSRILFSEPLQLRNLLVITSAFHMPRTRSIFEWIYNLPPSAINFNIDFVSTPDTGLSSDVLTARVQREKNSLANLEITKSKITTIKEFLHWLYTEHKAYAPNFSPSPLSEDELKSY